MTEEEAFGIVLRKYRKLMHLSQEELSFRASCDRSFVSLLERGKQSPSMKIVSTLARVLEVKVSQIMREVEELLEQN